jgi:hypothetical protein
MSSLINSSYPMNATEIFLGKAKRSENLTKETKKQVN